MKDINLEERIKKCRTLEDIEFYHNLICRKFKVSERRYYITLIDRQHDIISKQYSIMQ